MRKAEREVAYPAAEDAHKQQVAALGAAAREAHENVDSLNCQLQELQQQRQDIKAQVAALQQKADHIEQIVTEAEPRTRWASWNMAPQLRWSVRQLWQLRLLQRLLTSCCHNACRHQLSLYAHVSKITWQFEKSDRVAGTVADPLRTFDFDPATTPDHEIVNALWELMGTD